jgi:hypothetical protein
MIEERKCHVEKADSNAFGRLISSTLKITCLWRSTIQNWSWERLIYINMPTQKPRSHQLSSSGRHNCKAENINEPILSFDVALDPPPQDNMDATSNIFDDVNLVLAARYRWTSYYSGKILL